MTTLVRPIAATRRAVIAGGLVLTLGAFRSGEGIFAPTALAWPRWEVHDPVSTITVDHGPWDGFLAANVIAGGDGVNRIPYGRVVGRTDLDAYLDTLAGTDVDSLARPEQLAFWINLYNALTVRVVIDHHPVASIRDIDISPGLFASGPWDAPLVVVAGEALTLNDIEHRILRPLWRDARVHYAVNCASIGCPNLAATAWRSATVDAMLDSAAKDYVNHPRGVTIAGDQVTVSRIYDWFIEDFGGDDAGVIDHLARYAAPTLAHQLRTIGRLADTAYDWALNDADF